MKWAAAVVIALLLGFLAGRDRGRDTALERYAETFREQRAVKDSVMGLLASERADRKQLASLLEAATVMNGKLVAGLKVTVPGTVVDRPQTPIPTNTTPDGTRTGTVHDSTPDYVLDVNAVAKPTGPLELGWRVAVAPVDVQVGFVQLGRKYVAIASTSRGDSVRLEAPFVDPLPPPRFTLYGEGGWNLVESRPAVAAGGAMRLGPYSVNGRLSYVFAERAPPQLEVFLRRTW